MQGSCLDWICLRAVLEFSVRKLLSKLWKLHRGLTEKIAHFLKGALVVFGEGFELGELAWQEKNLNAGSFGWHEAEVGIGVSAGHSLLTCAQ